MANVKISTSKRVTSFVLALLMVFSMFTMLTSVVSVSAADSFTAPAVDGLTYVNGPYYIHNEYSTAEYLYDIQGENYLYGNGTYTPKNDGSDTDYMWLVYTDGTHNFLYNYGTGKMVECSEYGDYVSNNGDNNSWNTASWGTYNKDYYALTFTVGTGDTFTTTIVNYSAGTGGTGWANRPLHNGVNIGTFSADNAKNKVYSTSNDYGWGTKNWVFVKAALPSTGFEFNLKAVADGSSAINVSWDAVEGATSYEVFRSTNATDGFVSLGTTTETSFNDTNLAPDTTYYYKVQVTTADDSGESEVVSATTAEAVPTLKLDGSDANSVSLSWEYPTDGVTYNVYRSTDGENYTKITSTTDKSYTDTGLDSNVTYSYKVTVSKAASESFVVPAMSYNTTDNPPSGDAGTFRQDTLQSDGLYNAGWIGDTNWAQYTINAQYTGTYNVKLYVAAPNANISFYLNDEGNKDTPLAAFEDVETNSAWQSYKEYTTTLDLTKGANTVYFVAGSALNLWKMEYSIDTTADGADSNVVSATTSVLDAAKIVPTVSDVTVNTGDEFTVNATVKNEGTKDAEADVEVKFSFNGEEKTATVTADKLAVDASAEVSVVFTAPAGAADGTVLPVVVTADTSATANVTVNAPKLEVTDVSVVTVSAGKTFTATAVVKNNGHMDAADASFVPTFAFEGATANGTAVNDVKVGETAESTATFTAPTQNGKYTLTVSDTNGNTKTAVVEVTDGEDPAPGTLVGTYYIQNGFRNYKSEQGRTSYSEFVYDNGTSVYGNMQMIPNGMATAANSVNDVSSINLDDEYKWNVYVNGDVYYLKNVATKKYITYGNDSGNVISSVAYDGSNTGNMGFTMDPIVNGENDGDRTFTFADETIDTTASNVIGAKAFTTALKGGNNYLSAGFDDKLTFDTASTTQNVYVRNNRQGAELWNFIQVVEETENKDFALKASVDNKNSTVTLNWRTITGAAKYDVSIDGKTTTIDASNKSYIFKNVSVGKHNFSIRALDEDGTAIEDCENYSLTDVMVDEYVEPTPGEYIGRFYIYGDNYIDGNYQEFYIHSNPSESAITAANGETGTYIIGNGNAYTPAEDNSDTTYQWDLYKDSDGYYYIKNVATGAYFYSGTYSGTPATEGIWGSDYGAGAGNAMHLSEYTETSNKALYQLDLSKISDTDAEPAANTAFNAYIKYNAQSSNNTGKDDWGIRNLISGYGVGNGIAGSDTNHVYVYDPNNGSLAEDASTKNWHFAPIAHTSVDDGQYDISVVSVSTDLANGVAHEGAVYVVDAKLKLTDNNSTFDGFVDVTFTLGDKTYTETVKFNDRGEAFASAQLKASYPYSEEGYESGNSAYVSKVTVTATPAAGNPDEAVTKNNSGSTNVIVISNTATAAPNPNLTEDDENYGKPAVFTIRNSYHYNQPAGTYANSNIYIYDQLGTSDVMVGRFGIVDAANHGDVVIEAPTLAQNPEYFWYVDPNTNGILNYATHRYLTRTSISTGTYEGNAGLKMNMTFSFDKDNSAWYIFASGTHNQGACDRDASAIHANGAYVISAKEGNFQENVLGVEYPEYFNVQGSEYVTEPVTATYFPTFGDDGDKPREGCSWYLEYIELDEIIKQTYTVNVYPAVLDANGNPATNYNAGTISPDNSAVVDLGDTPSFTADAKTGYTYAQKILQAVTSKDDTGVETTTYVDVTDKLTSDTTGTINIKTPAATGNATYYVIYEALHHEWNFKVSIEGEGEVDAAVAGNAGNLKVVEQNSKAGDGYEVTYPNDANGANITAWHGETNGEYITWLTGYGDKVTVSATPAEGYTFAGWQDVRNKDVISTDPEFTIFVGTKNHIRAIFIKQDNIQEQDQIKVYVKNSVTGLMHQFGNVNYTTITKGTSPADALKDINFLNQVKGYVFEGFLVNGVGKDDSNNPYTLINELPTLNVETVITALYKVEERKSSINVNGTKLAASSVEKLGGVETADGYMFTSTYNQLFKITASNFDLSGNPFSYWTITDSRGTRVVTNNQSASFITGSEPVTYTAVYGDDANKLTKPQNTITGYSFDGNYLYIQEFFCDGGYSADRIVEKGVLLLKDTGDYVSSVTLDTPNVLRARSVAKSDSFYARKNNALGFDWYAQTYVIYKDEQGNVNIDYSDARVHIMSSTAVSYSAVKPDDANTIDFTNINNPESAQSNAYCVYRNGVVGSDNTLTLTGGKDANDNPAVFAIAVEANATDKYIVLDVSGTASRSQIKFANVYYPDRTDADFKTISEKAVVDYSGKVLPALSENKQQWIIDITKSKLIPVEQEGEDGKVIYDLCFDLSQVPGTITIHDIFVSNTLVAK